MPRQLAWLFCLGLANGIAMATDDLSPEAVFEQRLMPIFNSPNPSSCVQCHLSAVDLKDYILPSSRATFLALREQGLVDTERPRDSKILHLISRGDSDPDSLAQRIHAKTREAEYEAFAVWIEACCANPDLLDEAVSESSSSAGPVAPSKVIRHARKDRVLDSFVRNIWSQRMRCFPCHTPSELDPENPLHAKPAQRYRDFVDKYGRRMELFKETPERTLKAWMASSRSHSGPHLPLINVEHPLDSLVLLKPMAKLPPKGDDGQLGSPSSKLPVSHMGGIKMHRNDPSYKAFAAWLQDYARSVQGDYDQPSELPLDNWYPTQHVIRIKELPEQWRGLTVQVFVHEWDSALQQWSANPVAFTQSLVTPRRFLNGSLFAIAVGDQSDGLDPLGVELTPGRVQLRIYVDHERQLSDAPAKLLNEGPPQATTILQAKFQAGFKQADVIEGSQVVYDD